MEIIRKSPFSGVIHAMDLDVTQEQLDRFDNGRGEFVQVVFSHLSPGEREFIKTGITPEEWDAMFGDEV